MNPLLVSFGTWHLVMFEFKTRKNAKIVLTQRTMEAWRIFFLQNKRKTFPFLPASCLWAYFRFQDHSLHLSSRELLFSSFFRCLFSTMSKKKLLCWRVSKPQKKLHLRLIPKNEKVKKNFDSSFFLGGAAGNLPFKNFWEKVVFSSNFTLFCLFLRHVQCFVIFFPFFC